MFEILGVRPREDCVPFLVGLDDIVGKLQPLAVLDGIQNLGRAGLVVQPGNADIVALQHVAQLVADQVDDALEVERASDALLNAVDDRELAGALLELGRTIGTLRSRPSAKRTLASATAAWLASIARRSRSPS